MSFWYWTLIYFAIGFVIVSIDFKLLHRYDAYCTCPVGKHTDDADCTTQFSLIFFAITVWPIIPCGYFLEKWFKRPPAPTKLQTSPTSTPFSSSDS